MFIKKLSSNNRAVVGVVEAILLISLIAIILALIQITYIPQVMETREADHMDVVANQFSDLKFAVDLQSIMQADIPSSIPVTLGSRELPYFITARALGSITIPDDQCIVNVTDEEGITHSYGCGAIVFDSQNAYFVDQSYILECGTLIRSQHNGNTLIVEPSLSSSVNQTRITMNFTAINIHAYAEKDSINGYDTCFIRTNYSSKESMLFSNITALNISSSYPNAWNQAINTTLDSTTLNIVSSDDYVEVTPKLGYSVTLSLDVIDISAQVSPGWIGRTL